MAKLTPEKRRKLLKIFLTVDLLILIAVGLWFYHKSPQRQLMGKLITSVETQQPVLALTFDDGPYDPLIVDEVLDILDEFEIKATFFLIGEAMKSRPESVRQIVQRGHELANHSYSHKIMLFKSKEWIEREITTTDSIIRANGHSGEIYFRPPYGKKLYSLPAYLNANNRTTVTWDVDADSKDFNPAEITQNVLSHAKTGSIILMHVLVSSRKASREALPEVIRGLKDQGYTFLKLSELLSISDQNI